jgi:hypothetical protein
LILSHRVSDFVHKVGVHCESSALRDLFEYYGFQMSEAMVFGLDATMGFSFFDTTSAMSFIPESDVPFFLGGKQGTIEPSSLACRILGIILKKQSFSSADKAWEESKKHIDKNVPLIIQIDLGYLPYMVSTEEVHFGGHAVTLGGYDEDLGIAFVGDSEFEGFQHVPIEQLKAGRNSTYGPKFMHPHNAQFTMQPRSDGKHPPLAASVKLAIQNVANNMLRPSTNNVGIQGLKLFASTIPKWKEKLQGRLKDPKGKNLSKASVMFHLMHGYIETWGTGGALFRTLYRRFLEELLTLPELKEGAKAWTTEEFDILKKCLPLIDESAKSWSTLASDLKLVVERYDGDCLRYVNLMELQHTALRILEVEEKLFINLIKLRI